MGLKIQNGRIIDATNELDCVTDLYIQNEKIVGHTTPPLNFHADEIIDATGKIVCAGFVDLSVRLQNMAKEARVAASAGVTTFCVQPDIKPIIDAPEVVKHLQELAESANYPQIHFIGALTQKLEGNELSSMLSLQQAGCIAVSNGNFPIKNLLIMRRAMEYAASHDLLFVYRPNEFSLSNGGCAHEGAMATRYGLPSIPEAAESIALEQCLELAELTGCRVHFGQLSSKRAVIKLQQAKKYGLNVSADVSMHQLHFTENDVIPFDSNYHVVPPFRGEEDRDLLRAGLNNGTIDAICSDHQPHNLDAKLAAFPETKAGISTLETLVPLLLKLVADGVIDLVHGLALLNAKPAVILGLKTGTLSINAPADICIFDPNLEWRVDSENWKSEGINTPFWGQTLKGRVTHTIQAGKAIFSL
ncbi:MAG: dihydroorotase [Methylococcales bacterium]|nr:dihydroorotase [Methylococcales bacterium]